MPYPEDFEVVRAGGTWRLVNFKHLDRSEKSNYIGTGIASWLLEIAPEGCCWLGGVLCGHEHCGHQCHLHLHQRTFLFKHLRTRSHCHWNSSGRCLPFLETALASEHRSAVPKIQPAGTLLHKDAQSLFGKLWPSTSMTLG